MLTDLQIEKLPKPSARREIPDGRIGGLYLVVQPSGAKSWALRYRVAGAPKKFTIGSYPTISLAAARKRAQKALAEVVDGVDPSAQKKAAREAQKAANSTADRVSVVVDSYVKEYLGKNAKPSWAKEAARLLHVEVVPKFGKKRLGEITDDNVHKLLKEIAGRAPITANRTFAVFRKLCHWAMSRDGGRLIKTSPCDGVEMPTPERSRDRVLDGAEIKLVWEAFDSVGWPFGPIGKLLLLTGARRDEVASMEWRELNLEAAVWRLPKERTKNKRITKFRSRRRPSKFSNTFRASSPTDEQTENHGPRSCSPQLGARPFPDFRVPRQPLMRSLSRDCARRLKIPALISKMSKRQIGCSTTCAERWPRTCRSLACGSKSRRPSSTMYQGVGLGSLAFISGILGLMRRDRRSTLGRGGSQRSSRARNRRTWSS